MQQGCILSVIISFASEGEMLVECSRILLSLITLFIIKRTKEKVQHETWLKQ